MLKKFYDDFLEFVPLQLPELLDEKTMEQPIFYEDYALLIFPLPVPLDIEDVMDCMEDEMEMIVLYHHIPSGQTKFGHSCCAYSNPAFGLMFKINAKTNDSGLVENVTVTIYESLEFMSADICIDLDLHSKSGHFKYRKPKEEVLYDFI